MATNKCLICNHRPAFSGSPYCHNCQQRIAAEKQRRVKATPEKYLYYRGNWVGMYRASEDTLRPQYLGFAPIGDKSKVKPKYPMGKVLNLDGYLEGFSREQVKKMKRCILRLSAVTLK